MHWSIIVVSEEESEWFSLVACYLTVLLLSAPFYRQLRWLSIWRSGVQFAVNAPSAIVYSTRDGLRVLELPSVRFSIRSPLLSSRLVWGLILSTSQCLRCWLFPVSFGWEIHARWDPVLASAPWEAHISWTVCRSPGLRLTTQWSQFRVLRRCE